MESPIAPCADLIDSDSRQRSEISFAFAFGL